MRDTQSPSDASAAVTLRPSREGDVERAAALLLTHELPVDGLEACLHHGVVAVTPAGDVVGLAALEPYADCGLLRSVVVAPDWRRHGLCRRLCAACEAHARELGIERLYLLTEAAAPVFQALGYRVVARSRVPSPVRRSRQFLLLCPDTATAMERSIT